MTKRHSRTDLVAPNRDVASFEPVTNEFECDDASATETATRAGACSSVRSATWVAPKSAATDSETIASDVVPRMRIGGRRVIVVELTFLRDCCGDDAVTSCGQLSDRKLTRRRRLRAEGKHIPRKLATRSLCEPFVARRLR